MSGSPARRKCRAGSDCIGAGDTPCGRSDGSLRRFRRTAFCTIARCLRRRQRESVSRAVWPWAGDISAVFVVGGGTIVGRLVSITIRSGHLCDECSRMMLRSTSARAGSLMGFGMYRSARIRSASSRLPTKTKYRPRGMPTTISRSPLSPVSTGGAAMVPFADCSACYRLTNLSMRTPNSAAPGENRIAVTYREKVEHLVLPRVADCITGNWRRTT